MNQLSITIYILIGLGVLAGIFALIWTKMIKPDTTEDKLRKLTSFPMIQFKKCIKKIEKSNKYSFYNLIINKSDLGNKSSIYIPGIVISDKYVYLFASPIFSDKNITFKKGQYFWNKDVNLKVDEWYEHAVLFLAKKLSVSEKAFQLVIPIVKKTKNVHQISSFKEIKDNPIFKKHSDISEHLAIEILKLNITNIKKGRK